MRNKWKPDSSREVSKWETLERDLLTIIFKKLDVMDLTNGASRVCVYWFLVSHDKTLWQTVDLAKLQQVVVSYRPRLGDKVRRPVVSYNYQVEEGLRSRTLLAKMSMLFFKVEKGKNLRKLLIEITNLSGSVTKNLIFHSHSYVREMDLMLGGCQTSRNLFYRAGAIKRRSHVSLRLVNGRILKHCSLLMITISTESSSFKLSGRDVYFHANRWPPKPPRILNLRHCAFNIFDMFPEIDDETFDLPNKDLVQSAKKKLEKYIRCSPGCSFCKGWLERFHLTSLDASPWHPYDKDWQHDEIEEFVF
ncbi:unnamed protein product [Arabis nemorensis]|uniref:F-box domain-containing protein n=1 Tax=Arabis nemorensis TaxID=586526 RepID=A0A565C8U3_9BRAS|nr:unnamed protein product [Arabis nemorensis]